MKNQFIRSILAAVLAAGACSVQAQPDAHYPPGTEGIKGASLPPPGWYVRDYNFMYVTDTVNNNAGVSVGPPNFHSFTYANVPRGIWITDVKFLGGNVGVDALLPLIYQSTRAGGFNNSTFGIGDFFAESTLSWHLKQFDFSAAAGTWMPTGDSAKPPTTRVGSGYWTPMLTAGATWYADQAKTWSLSALSRYEFNTEQRDTHVTPGQAYTLEWGLAKTLFKVVDAGVVGYYQEKTTMTPRNEVAAIGPEVSVAFPSAALFVSARYEYEYLADNRAQGHTVTVTLTKRF
jgi:hypothetical protein